MSGKEAQARVKIDKLLLEANWRLVEERGKKPNVICEHRITKKRYSTDSMGDDFEKAKNGFVDYVFFDNSNKPIGVLEAKRESVNPLEAKEQARTYAQSLNVRHIFLSNGNVHYYWDLEEGNPQVITKFLSLEELGEAKKWNPNPSRL
ncbi:MAG: type I restriction enzyme HsdR N-terminal domain-containing protein [Leptospiraceae bacterium]|nr:type I restriction enzyme HsdR N-terminal domain-containing protein [Leptospiraceae bacterium]MCP5494544.1 type I restriction enzyme HsdR N-terminal domain-containing protein [Leptospiraceae bacterium]